MEEDAIYLVNLSDRAILEMLGDFVQKTRLRQNKTQQEISEAAGINRSTLVQLEQGKGGTMLTFIHVLRALEQLPQLSSFETLQELTPIQPIEMEMKQRKRAGRKTPLTTKNTKFTQSDG